MTSKAFMIPLFLSFFVTLGPFFLYAICAKLGHLKNVIPFISDTGVRAPEAPLFTILFNLGAFLVALIVYIRSHIFEILYNKQMEQLSPNCAINRRKQLNLWSQICGSLTVIGLIIIGNFRASEMNGTHNFGTYITCVFGIFDIILQSQIAFNTAFKRTAILRLIIVSVIIPSFFAYIFLEMINKKMWAIIEFEDLSTGSSLAAVFEWIGFCMFGPFYATFIPEFRRLKNIKIVHNVFGSEKQLLYLERSSDVNNNQAS